MSIDFEFTDPMAQEIFSGVSDWYANVKRYRMVTLKDNYHWGEAEEHLRQTLAHIELAAGHWKKGARRP